MNANPKNAAAAPDPADPAEIGKFSRDAGRWWDEAGPFAPLHRLNRVRLRYIRDRIAGHFSRTPDGAHPFKNLKILDIGCGGGLICEPLTRLGAAMTGIDADAKAIETAAAHAAGGGLDITYARATAGEFLNSRKQKFDVVLALEIVEHVPDIAGFVKNCADLCKPGGLMIFSTLNRTPKSFLLGVVAAEYVLRWVPQGTHDWKKFIKPSELARALSPAGAIVADITGLRFNPLAGDFELSHGDVAVNYFLSAEKKP